MINFDKRYRDSVFSLISILSVYGLALFLFDDSGFETGFRVGLLLLISAISFIILGGVLVVFRSFSLIKNRGYFIYNFSGTYSLLVFFLQLYYLIVNNDATFSNTFVSIMAVIGLFIYIDIYRKPLQSVSESED